MKSIWQCFLDDLQDLYLKLFRTLFFFIKFYGRSSSTVIGLLAIRDMVWLALED